MEGTHSQHSERGALRAAQDVNVSGDSVHFVSLRSLGRKPAYLMAFATLLSGLYIRLSTVIRKSWPSGYFSNVMLVNESRPRPIRLRSFSRISSLLHRSTQGDIWK